VTQETLWEQFPKRRQHGFLLGVQRAFDGDSGVLFMRDQRAKNSGTLMSDKCAKRLVTALVEFLEEREKSKK
jgi:hypothetical protein